MQQFGSNGYLPASVLLRSRYINAIVSKPQLRTLTQPYLTEDPGSRIPSGIRRMMIHTDSYGILSVLNQIGNVKLECRVSILPLSCKGIVDIDLTVHVHAIKTKTGAYAVLFLINKPLPVPSGRCLV